MSTFSHEARPVAIVTGASQGLGRALATALAEAGWDLVIDARRADRLTDAAQEIQGRGASVTALVGDITDPSHRHDLVAAARDRPGPLRLLVNNASTLGASPLPALDEVGAEVFARTFAVNVIAPVALTAAALPDLAGGTVVNITSDAGAEAYEGWGVYGSSKAALEHAGRVLAVEHPEVRVLAVDPGDLRTEMHQDAFPGEDISDRPLPEVAVPGLLALIAGDRPSGRYSAQAEAVAS
jgi:NAD(P)-dependent dehydrogenase (short-subunit alcohol dehydrogenase family)